MSEEGACEGETGPERVVPLTRYKRLWQWKIGQRPNKKLKSYKYIRPDAELSSSLGKDSRTDKHLCIKVFHCWPIFAIVQVSSLDRRSSSDCFDDLQANHKVLYGSKSKDPTIQLATTQQQSFIFVRFFRLWLQLLQISEFIVSCFNFSIVSARAEILFVLCWPQFDVLKCLCHMSQDFSGQTKPNCIWLQISCILFKFIGCTNLSCKDKNLLCVLGAVTYWRYQGLIGASSSYDFNCSILNSNLFFFQWWMLKSSAIAISIRHYGNLLVLLELTQSRFLHLLQSQKKVFAFNENRAIPHN